MEPSRSRRALQDALFGCPIRPTQSPKKAQIQTKNAEKPVIFVYFPKRFAYEWSQTLSSMEPSRSRRALSNAHLGDSITPSQGHEKVQKLAKTANKCIFLQFLLELGRCEWSQMLCLMEPSRSRRALSNAHLGNTIPST